MKNVILAALAGFGIAIAAYAIRDRMVPETPSQRAYAVVAELHELAQWLCGEQGYDLYGTCGMLNQTDPAYVVLRDMSPDEERLATLQTTDSDLYEQVLQAVRRGDQLISELNRLRQSHAYQMRRGDLAVYFALGKAPYGESAAATATVAIQ